MSSNLKIRFKENSATQYDANATLIDLATAKGSEYGKLYIGDKHSASYVQLKFRKCTTVVNCSRQLHGYSLEPDVDYHNIDPISGDSNVWLSSYHFIRTALKKQKNVTVHCDSGRNKSAAIVIHFIMKLCGISLAESVDFVADAWAANGDKTLELSPQLNKELLKLEIEYFGRVSMQLNGQQQLVPSVSLGVMPSRRKKTKKRDGKGSDDEEEESSGDSDSEEATYRAFARVKKKQAAGLNTVSPWKLYAMYFLVTMFIVYYGYRLVLMPSMGKGRAAARGGGGAGAGVSSSGAGSTWIDGVFDLVRGSKARQTAHTTGGKKGSSGSSGSKGGGGRPSRSTGGSKGSRSRGR